MTGALLLMPLPASSRTRPKADDPGSGRYGGRGMIPERTSYALGSPVPARRWRAVREDEERGSRRNEMQAGAVYPPLSALPTSPPLFFFLEGERGAWGMTGNLPLCDTASHAHEYIFRIIA